MVADAVLLLVGEVGMRGTIDVPHLLVVLAVLVGVADEEADGRARRSAFEDAAQQLHLVGFLAGRSEMALAGLATGQLALNEIHIDLDARRHAVDDATDACTVALAEAGKAEKRSKRIHAKKVLN